MPNAMNEKKRTKLFPYNFRLLLLAMLLMHVLMAMASFYPPIISNFGLVPQLPERLYGIFTAPFIHASWGHLTGNSIGLFISGYLASLQAGFKRVTVFIMVVTGCLVWVFGEYGNHIGASGIVMGYYGFLFGTAVFNRNLIGAISFTVLVAVTYYMDFAFLATLLDFSAQTSSSNHIFGFISGLLGAYIFRRKVKKPKSAKNENRLGT